MAGARSLTVATAAGGELAGDCSSHGGGQLVRGGPRSFALQVFLFSFFGCSKPNCACYG
jgi:hypothetical protein